MLSRGLVFELPVPREALATVCENIANLEHYISRAVALGLLEVSHDQALRVPRILPVQLPKDGEVLHKQAAEVLYRLWWEEAETRIEEQQLEIHRLALLGKVDKIALEIAGKLASYWKSQSRFREAVQLCKSTLEIAEDYLVLHQLARSEQALGEVSKAQDHYQKALDQCPAKDEKEKAAIIHNFGYLKADRGEIEAAIALYQQSLAITEQIGDVQGKATTLHEMGRLKANRGEIEEATALYEQSLAITEPIGDVETKAATLHNLGSLKADRGEIKEALIFYKQSLVITEQIGNVQGQAATLHQLGILKANSGEIKEAIALYERSLALKEQIGDIGGQAVTLQQLGILKANSGEIKEAIALYKQSFAITEQIGDVQGQAMTLWCLGHIAEQQGDYNQALDYLQPALEILQRIQSPDAEKVRQMVARVQGLIRNS
ncbi:MULTISPECIES: tetratricopeptide repeat protein [unclassified Nostoc]|nr:tetratricopeptide repeat protein [Nostoc sp. JL34]